MKTKTQHVVTPQEKHLRSALENEGYSIERVNEIVQSCNSYSQNQATIKALVKLIEEYVPCNCEEGNMRWSSYKCRRHIAIAIAEKSLSGNVGE